MEVQVLAAAGATGMASGGQPVQQAATPNQQPMANGGPPLAPVILGSALANSVAAGATARASPAPVDAAASAGAGPLGGMAQGTVPLAASAALACPFHRADGQPVQGQIDSAARVMGPPRRVGPSVITGQLGQPFSSLVEAGDGSLTPSPVQSRPPALGPLPPLPERFRDRVHQLQTRITEWAAEQEHQGHLGVGGLERLLGHVLHCLDPDAAAGGLLNQRQGQHACVRCAHTFGRRGTRTPPAPVLSASPRGGTAGATVHQGALNNAAQLRTADMARERIRMSAGFLLGIDRETEAGAAVFGQGAAFQPDGSEAGDGSSQTAAADPSYTGFTANASPRALGANDLITPSRVRSPDQTWPQGCHAYVFVLQDRAGGRAPWTERAIKIGISGNPVRRAQQIHDYAGDPHVRVWVYATVQYPGYRLARHAEGVLLLLRHGRPEAEPIETQDRRWCRFIERTLHDHYARLRMRAEAARLQVGAGGAAVGDPHGWTEWFLRQAATAASDMQAMAAWLQLDNRGPGAVATRVMYHAEP